MKISKVLLAACVTLLILLIPASVSAQAKKTTSQEQTTPALSPTPLVPKETPPSGVDLALSPPFISLITDPGKEVKSEFAITNNNNFREYLKITVAKYVSSGGQVVLSDVKPSDEFAKWISFSENQFIVDPGERKTISFRINPSDEARLGYYYALIIQRIQKETDPNASAVISGAPAISVLLNVKSQNAKKELQLIDFSTDKFFYEYLPTEFKVKVKNTGNIHVVPVGDIFIDSTRMKEIATLHVNEGRGNVLPDSERTFSILWNDGFATRELKRDDKGNTVTDSKGNNVYKTSFDFQKADKFRIGKYTANVILVYDNGERDVPLEAEVSFWVVPWKIILIIIVLVGFAFLGLKNAIFSNVRRVKKVIGS